MVRIRSGLLVAVVALGLGAGACKKSDDKGSPTADKTSEAGGKGDKPAAAQDDLSLLPANSEIVVGINFAQLQQSALFKEIQPKLQAMQSKDMAAWKAACGIDPTMSFKSMALGMNNIGGTGDPEVTMVVRGVEKSKVMGCFDKAKEEGAKNGIELAKDGDVITFKGKQGKGGALTWINDSTILGVIGTAGTKDGVLAAAKGGAGLKTSQAFLDIYSKINTQDSLWLLMNGNSPIFQKGGLPIKPKAVFGSLNITDGVTLEGRVRFNTPDDATQQANMVKGMISNPQIKQMTDKLDVAADGTDMKVSVAIGNQKVHQIGQMLGGMFGGMMGGGMGGP